MTSQDNILDKNLYGSKSNLTAKSFYNIQKKSVEYETKREKLSIGGIIFTKKSIADVIINNFNNNQKKHIENNTINHKFLCEKKDEPGALIFINLYILFNCDNMNFIQNKVNNLKSENDYKNLYEEIRGNIEKYIITNYYWIIAHSKNIIRNYYNITFNKLKIKLNFLLDDNKYYDHGTGGILINIINELIYYEKNLIFENDECGIICEILIPTGAPEKRKWAQIDLGITCNTKRLLHETPIDTLTRNLLDTYQILLHKDLIQEIDNDEYKIQYSEIDNLLGCEIFFIEIFYIEQILIFKEKELDYSFCKCKEREDIILLNKK